MSKPQRTTRYNWRKSAIPIAVAAMLLAQPASLLAAEASAATVLTEAAPAAGSAGGGQVEAVQPAKPQAKISEDEAVEIVRKLFPEQMKNVFLNSVQLGDFYSYPPGNQNVYTIQWEVRQANHSFGFSSRVDSMTGELIQHDMHYSMDTNQATYYPPEVSREEAYAAAKAFLLKAAPSLDSSGLHDAEHGYSAATRALFGPVQYDFAFTLDVNGVKAANSTTMISVDGKGRIISFYRNPGAGAYPSPTPSVKPADAEKALDAASTLKLQYVPIRTSSYGIDHWELAWIDANPGGYVDAQTGEIIDYSGSTLQPLSEPKPVPKQEKIYTAAPHGDKDQLTSEEAAARAVALLGISDEYTLTSQYMRPDYMNGAHKSWQLQFNKAPQPGQPYADEGFFVNMDAATGQIIDYNARLYMPPWAQQPKATDDDVKPITAEQAEAAAMAWVGLLYPSASEDLLLTSYKTGESTGAPVHSFIFQRYYKDIQVGPDTANVTLDASGKLVYYSGSRTEELESKVAGLEAKVSKEAATEAYRKERTLELQYAGFGGYYTDTGPIPYTTKLVYARMASDFNIFNHVLSAATGEWTSLYPDSISQEKESPVQLPADLKGHWAEEPLSILLEHGVIKPDEAGLLHPDQALKRGDWMNMVMRAAAPHYEGHLYGGMDNEPLEYKDVKKDSPYYTASQFYIQQRMGDSSASPELQPEQLLTREALAEALVQLINYSKLSRLLQAGTLQAADAREVAQEHKGAVALALQLGLLTLNDESRFEPGASVTLAEGAAAMMRIVALQGKLDQNIFYR